MYEILKDFASPVVTLIAAIVAGCITFTFARIQARIAESQRDIALDRLKFDLLQRRYAVYEATKELLEYLPFIHDLEKSNASKIRLLYIKLDEARFYFPPDICSFLKEIHGRSEAFFEDLAKRDRLNIDDRERWSKLADILAGHQAAFRTIYASLPEKFESSLAFEQLTRHPKR
jgi:hypothetical protein